MPEPVPSLSRHGLKLGVLGFFPVIKITVVCLLHISLHLLRSECEDKTCVKHAWCTKIVNVLVLRLFLRMWLAKTRRPQIELHG